MITVVNHGIDSDKAKEIAIKYLEQHHSVIEATQAVLKDDIWSVTVSTSSFGEQARKIRIDAKTGRILSHQRNSV
ncbi:MAG: hypothetical protein ACHQ1D_03490 [Nitrososphaerales archaeon]